MTEIRQHLDRLAQLSNTMKEQLARLSGLEGEQIKKKVKEQGTRIGIGVGVTLMGLVIAGVAGLYLMWVITLLVNIALDRLWLSALIVVGGSLILGGVVAAVGVSIARSSAKELAKATDDIKAQIKAAGDEMKAELEALQKLFKKEAEVRRVQIKELAETAKSNAPVIVPVVIGAFLVLRFLKKRAKSRKEKRFILKVLEIADEARAGY
jgi:predicted PurR-regulated permease PerM